MRLGIDTGGTFTDAVLFDADLGVVRSAKSPTTHHNLALGIKDVINKIDTDKNIKLCEVVEFTSLSTTLATNAIVEGHGGSICLLLVGHNASTLDRSALKESLRNDPVEFIDGGHNALGEPAKDLDKSVAREAILRHADNVSAFAIAGVFSVRNTEHEVAVRDLVIKLTDKPVTCSHELTAELDAPRRAMTAVLNARLIAPISQLISSVRSELQARSITTPLMVVKGDGSMIGAEIAVNRPVETVLSGPAASIVGACYLSKTQVRVVSDIGGTTTDIATVENGHPRIARRGATVGGFKTFVEAVDAYTVGIGGDSQVSFNKPVLVGPQRALPLCMLAHEAPEILDVLEDQLKRMPSDYQGCFAVKRRNIENAGFLGKSGERLWKMLSENPVSLEELFKDMHLFRAFGRLRKLDIVSLSAFTPTDALHVLGDLKYWQSDAPEIGAHLWARGFQRGAKPLWDSPPEFCRDVVDAVVKQTCDALVNAMLAHESKTNIVPSLDPALLEIALDQDHPHLLNIQLSVNGALAAVGAPAASFYHDVAKKLNTKLVIPEFAEVGNAVGTVAGGVTQRLSGLITSPAEGLFRAHTPFGVKDFHQLESAAEHTGEILKSLVYKRALSSHSSNPVVSLERNDTVVKIGIDASIFIESKITATARGETESIATKIAVSN